MRVGAFELHEPLPELREPHAVGMLRPWVDVGNVGTLALARLERHFRAHELGRIARPGTFFDFTRYRPTIRMMRGERVLTTPNSIITYAKRVEKPDFLFLHLLEPHAFAEDYVESLLDVFKTMGVKRYCRLGGMYDAVPHTRPLLITGNVSHGQQSGNIQLRRSTYQGPTSIMYMMSDELSQLGIESTNLMVHLPQYVQLEEDYAGTARLLEAFCSMYNLPMRLTQAERGQTQYREVDAEIARNPEVTPLVERLEAYYDSRTASSSEESPPLSPDVENFLRQIGEQLDDH